MKRVFFIFIAGVLLTACGFIQWGFTRQAPMMDPGGAWFNRSYSSNGERIYFTATNHSGQRIPYRGGTYSGGMMMGMGNNLACVSCHGPDGRGGLHNMHMIVMDAPDIRYVALSSEADEHDGEHNGDEHDDAHGEYDLEAFRRAVVEGRHPNGDPLSREMPRWQLDDEDLSDLFDYLRSLE